MFSPIFLRLDVEIIVVRVEACFLFSRPLCSLVLFGGNFHDIIGLSVTRHADAMSLAGRVGTICVRPPVGLYRVCPFVRAEHFSVQRLGLDPMKTMGSLDGICRNT